MSTTATASFKSPSHTHSHSHSKSHSHSHSHSSSHSRPSRPSTTPRVQPSAASVGQSMPPLLTPNPRSPPHLKDPKSPSPSYFGFVVGDESIPPDSNPGVHARQNWNFPSTSSQGPTSTSRHVAVESNPEFEAFRRQSENNHRFTLNSSMSSLGRPSQSRTVSTASIKFEPAALAVAKTPGLEWITKSKDGPRHQDTQMEEVSFFDMPRQASPASISHQPSVAEHQHARLSLPMTGVRSPALLNLKQATRSDTLPTSTDKETTAIVPPLHIGELLKAMPAKVLVLDLRVYHQFATSRVTGALNLCIPTTLLKRPSYNVQKLAETFTSDYDKETFARWKECSHIVVYDLNSSLAKEAVIPLIVLKKFNAEGWAGTGLVIKGGFLAFSKTLPSLVDSGPVASSKSATSQPLSISSSGKEALSLAGGCAMPSDKSAANAFFGNIRQNTDLLDGVGQMPIKKPANMSQSMERHLPNWLQQASAKGDEGKAVSERFLKIEKHEQRRMQEALRVQVSYGTPRPDKPKQIQVAGIEKGSKNRYNNIFPYDHTRVKLQNVPQGSCDYINASHVKAQFSNRRYIATQAPIPATFNDFWRVVWEQDVRVIVMLTAESEGGQVKSHKYWSPGEYGPLKLKQLSERQVSLESKKHASKAPPSTSRPSLGARRSTTANIPTDQKGEDIKSPTSKASSVMVRHLALSHSAYPFQPMREITLIQYADWPDLGIPASPMELLGLVEQVNKYVRSCAKASDANGPHDAAPAGQRPILVHCSAGCGRTGTFCTIDSVIDMLKRQRISRHGDHMDVDGGDDWVSRDDVDLVAKTVDDFRHQRLSMVQTLRQFVLCYESILQWLVVQDAEGQTQKPKRPGVQESRRSYQG